MKKLIITFAAALFCGVMVSAQDMASAVEAFNNGINANEAGNVELAIDSFKEALSIASQLGDEGAKIVSDCKASIPALQFSIAKKAVNNAEYEKAVSALKETVAVANEYEVLNIAEEAKALIPQILMQQANAALNEKNYELAVAGYKAVLEDEPANGMAALRLGSALKATGDKQGAAEAFKTAMENGQEKTAAKQLSTLYQQEASAALKAKKYDDAISAALEANKYVESATSYKIAGTAATSGKKLKEATEYFEKYLELSPNDSGATQICYNLAVCYHQLGNKAKAKEYYQKAVDDPKFGAAAKQQLSTL